jgi:hypothetical protein
MNGIIPNTKNITIKVVLVETAASTPVNIINGVDTSATTFFLPTILNIPTKDAVRIVQLIAYPTHLVHNIAVGSIFTFRFIIINKYEITVIKLTNHGKSDSNLFRFKKK